MERAARWLQKAMQALSKKEVDANTVFEIISSAGFYDKVTPRMASGLESFGLKMSSNTQRTLFFWHQQRDLAELFFKHL